MATKKSPKKKKPAKAKEPRVKLPAAQAKRARAMLREIRGMYDDAKNGKKSGQRKLVF